MTTAYPEQATPCVLLDRRKLEANIASMQATCRTHGVELRPHIKTHKMVEVARRQLAAGAAGLTCAKLGEAEAMLPSGVRSLFVAHSLVDHAQAPRIAALGDRLDDFRVAVTSEVHAPALTQVARAAGRKLAVMMAVDTGLGREGLRSPDDAQRLATLIARSPNLELHGFYTHEGHFYGAPRDQLAEKSIELIERLDRVRNAIDPGLPIWPGCSVSARLIASHAAGRVQAVRPGAYMFGDLALSRKTGVMSAGDVAVQVLATVVDKPEPGLALIDAGSKTFSSDRTADNIYALAADGRDLTVVRVNEEHGYVRGEAVATLAVGERVAFTPAHICPVINLTDEVVVTADSGIESKWKVDARGKTQ
ncbi:MAG: alanine racemase [Opitutaceae bacterium]|nr:alanine racemase [Opitutaceae bacterium]